MGQIWRIVLVALLVGMSLSACSPSPAPSPAATQETSPSPTQGVLAYPSPDSTLPTTPQLATSQPTDQPPASTMPPYVAPAQELPNYSPYPGPSEGINNYLDWAKAEELILGGKVAKVYHAQTRYITLVLKDGSLAATIEPTLDEVFKVIEKCGQACSDIEQIKQ